MSGQRDLRADKFGPGRYHVRRASDRRIVGRIYMSLGKWYWHVSTGASSGAFRSSRAALEDVLDRYGDGSDL